MSTPSSILNAKRRALNLSVSDVRAAMAVRGADVTPSAVSRWFADGEQARTPTLGHLSLLMEALRMTPREKISLLDAAAGALTSTPAAAPAQ